MVIDNTILRFIRSDPSLLLKYLVDGICGNWEDEIEKGSEPCRGTELGGRRVGLGGCGIDHVKIAHVG